MPYKDPEKNKESKHNWYIKNRERYLEANRQWKINNKERFKKLYRAWSEKNKEKMRDASRNWYIKNRDLVIERYKNKYSLRHKTPDGRLKRAVSFGVYKSLKELKGGRKWEGLVGYSFAELKEHLEKLFDDNMNWENYGSYWHLDHIRPLVTFDCTDNAQFIECWSLKNLQPLEAKENIRKGGKYITSK